MRVRREGQHAHDLADLVQLAPLSLAEVLPRVSAKTQCSLETSALPPPPPRHQLRLPKPSPGGAQKPAPHIWGGVLPHRIQPLVLPDELNELLDPQAKLQAALRVKTTKRPA